MPHPRRASSSLVSCTCWTLALPVATRSHRWWPLLTTCKRERHARARVSFSLEQRKLSFRSLPASNGPSVPSTLRRFVVPLPRRMHAGTTVSQIVIVAEGVPERQARLLRERAGTTPCRIIGPASVGVLYAGQYRLGNIGGTMENVVTSVLYQPGSIGFVTRSGGLANELNHILSVVSDGVHSGIAIGGDRYPCTADSNGSSDQTHCDMVCRTRRCPCRCPWRIGSREEQGTTSGGCTGASHWV